MKLLGINARETAELHDVTGVVLDEEEIEDMSEGDIEDMKEKYNRVYGPDGRL